jgi:dihydroneopterin aldolase
VVDAVRDLVAQHHTNLVETLAEQIAACCLSDRRVRRVRAQVEKLDALPDATAGIEIHRWSAQA